MGRLYRFQRAWLDFRIARAENRVSKLRMRLVVLDAINTHNQEADQ